MVTASFQWSDIGSWDELAHLWEQGRVQPRQTDSCYSLQSHDNLVHSDQPVVLCGVHDLVVVAHAGALLICARGKAQLVKQAVASTRAEIS